MSRPQTLYDRTVKVTQDYLGPAGERFMRRQIYGHIGIEPEKLDHEDLSELIDWVRQTFALLTDDAEMVAEFSARLSLLASNKLSDVKKA